MGSFFLFVMYALSANERFGGGRHAWAVMHCPIAVYL